VYSFPRLLHRGGWQQVTDVVRTLREQEETKQPAFVMKQKWQEEELVYDTDYYQADNNKFITRVMELEASIHLYAMSGSFGDVNSDFLRQMRLSFCGVDTQSKHVVNGRLEKLLLASSKTDWTDIKKTYCLWPSQHMVQNMNPIAVICRGRPISYKHWENSIPDEARRRLFFDAIPNPDGPSLLCSTASQIAAGAGGVNSSKINQGKYRLRAGLLESYYWTDSEQAERWCSRLPYRLPVHGEMPPAGYRPGRRADVFEKVQGPGNCKRNSNGNISDISDISDNEYCSYDSKEYSDVYNQLKDLKTFQEA